MLALIASFGLNRYQMAIQISAGKQKTLTAAGGSSSSSNNNSSSSSLINRRTYIYFVFACPPFLSITLHTPLHAESKEKPLWN
jgi:hypothetical protein